MIRVMLVDDQKRELDGMQGVIDWAAMGMEIVAAVTSAREALRLFPELKPEIIISDVVMPDMDGLNLLAEFRMLSPGVKVILMSCFDDFKFVSAAVNGGASGYLLKPILSGELRKLMARVVQEAEAEKRPSAAEKPMRQPSVSVHMEEILIRTESGMLQGSGEGLAHLLEGAQPGEDKLVAAAILGACAGMGGDVPPSWMEQLQEAEGKEALCRFLSGVIGKAEGKGPSDSKMAAVNQMRENIEKNLNQEITQRLLMENVYMSSGYASTLFKNVMGMTTHQYIMNRRLQTAATLLLEKPEMKIYDVAQVCGFSDASHLINQFQKKYRITPAQYRMRGKNL